MNIELKLQVLRESIANRRSVLISFSGGVDSSLLAVLAREILVEKMHCVMLISPLIPRSALIQAQTIADEFGLPLDIITQDAFRDARIVTNQPDRCYWCKKQAAALLREFQVSRGFSFIADGMNLSDTKEYRPGLSASTEEGIIHPFLEAGITKGEIREIARTLGLDFWDKPPAPCLASRIPYGEEINIRKLSWIEEAEEYLHSCGYHQFRVRIHGSVARIETMPDELRDMIRDRKKVSQRLRAIGFTYVTLDLEGYRSGSMDEGIKKNVLNA